MKPLIIVLLLVLVSWCFFIVGIEYEEAQVISPSPDVELGIKFLKELRQTHQQFIDNPDKLHLASYPSMEHHIYCVLKYNYIINLLEEVNEYNRGYSAGYLAGRGK